jgi:CheY-like chemotaxis protein
MPLLERIVTDLQRAAILVAENNVLVRNLISTILGNQGYLVLAAANHAEGLEIARGFKGEIRLLITRNSDLAQAIKGERPETRVILLSERVSAELREIAHKVDPAAFLRHGSLPRELVIAIEKAMDSSADSRSAN